LTVAIHPAVTLLHAVRIPRDLVMDELPAVILEVDALRRCIGGEQDANGGILGIGLKSGFDAFAIHELSCGVLHRHPTINGKQAILSRETFGS